MATGLESLRRTIAGTFDYSGRARRLDFAWFWLASMLLGGLLDAILSDRISSPQALLVYRAFGFVLALPFFALFVRRRHDQGRSGWWLLMLPPVMAENLYKDLRIQFHPLDPAWPALGSWSLLLLPLVILVMIFLIVPGEIGPNRYGPDPRPEPEVPATA